MDLSEPIGQLLVRLGVFAVSVVDSDLLVFEVGVAVEAVFVEAQETA